MSKYINPFLDWSFKHIFGRESVKDILIGFLNALFDGKHVIVDIEFKNNEHQPEDKRGRAMIYDIFCTTDTGERIIVEMQNSQQKYFKDRALYYMSQSVVEPGETGNWDFKLNAVYGVFFMNFRFDEIPDKESSLTEVALVDTASGAIFNPKFQQYYIELPSFNKTEQDCESMYDKWIFILKNMDTMETMPFAEERNAIFARLEETAARANLTKEEREQYEEQWRNYNDYYNAMDYAVEKGEKKGFDNGYNVGLEEGREEGRTQGIIETARMMKAQGCSSSLIATCTGLKIEEIDKL